MSAEILRESLNAAMVRTAKGKGTDTNQVCFYAGQNNGVHYGRMGSTSAQIPLEWRLAQVPPLNTAIATQRSGGKRLVGGAAAPIIPGTGVDPGGGGETDMAATITATAGVALSALRAVWVVGGLLQYADPTNEEYSAHPVYFLNNAYSVGAVATAYSYGMFTDASWSWGDSIIWLGPAGTLVASPTIATGYFLRILAEPISPTQILFNPRERILYGDE